MLIVDLILLLGAQKALKITEATARKLYRVVAWTDSEKAADRLFSSLKGEAYRARVATSDKAGPKEIAGYLVCQEYYNSDTVRPIVDFLKMKGYAVKVSEDPNSNRLRLQVGEVFPTKTLAQKLVNKIAREEKQTLEVQPFYRQVKVPGYSVIVEDVPEDKAQELKKQLKKYVKSVEVVPY